MKASKVVYIEANLLIVKMLPRDKQIFLEKIWTRAARSEGRGAGDCHGWQEVEQRRTQLSRCAEQENCRKIVFDSVVADRKSQTMR